MFPRSIDPYCFGGAGRCSTEIETAKTFTGGVPFSKGREYSRRRVESPVATALYVKI